MNEIRQIKKFFENLYDIQVGLFSGSLTSLEKLMSEAGTMRDLTDNVMIYIQEILEYNEEIHIRQQQENLEQEITQCIESEEVMYRSTSGKLNDG
jgi:uncharacterized protein YihD (DUF1040 family)